jgi:hypothetical protein
MGANDPNVFWDGQRWWRWDGAQWSVDAPPTAWPGETAAHAEPLPPEQLVRVRRPRDVLGIALGLCLLLSGAAAAIAPFLTLERIKLSALGFTESINGWGTVSGESGSTHSMRLGVLLVACAALLLVTASSTLLRPRHASVAIAALGACAATVSAAAAAALSANAALSTNSAVASVARLHVTLGPGQWLIYAAGAFAAAGAALAMIGVRAAQLDTAMLVLRAQTRLAASKAP